MTSHFETNQSGPGNLIACGRSLGACPLRPGSRIEIAIDGIGALPNTFEGKPPQ